MTKAIQIYGHGDASVMRWEDIEVPPPAADQVRLRHTAIGFNFSEINLRRGGFYPTGQLKFPLILGNEAVGVATDIGKNVKSIKAGDRVAYVGVGDGPFWLNPGAYAEERNVPESSLIKLPEGVSDHQAASLLLKGLTAAAVINRLFKPAQGDTVLIHAAASGVGLMLSQWSKHLGATVIGTVGSKEKAKLAQDNGCDHAILYRETDFVAEVKKIVPRGVDAVFDGVGKDTFIPSFDCTRPFGMLVNYGNASGHVPHFDLMTLAMKGSLRISRLAANSHVTGRADYIAACDELFDLLNRGVIRLPEGRTYALRDAASAHRDVEERKTIGPVVLVP